MPKRMRAEMYGGKTDTEWGRVRMDYALHCSVEAGARLAAAAKDLACPDALRTLVLRDLAKGPGWMKIGGR